MSPYFFYLLPSGIFFPELDRVFFFFHIFKTESLNECEIEVKEKIVVFFLLLFFPVFFLTFVPFFVSLFKTENVNNGQLLLFFVYNYFLERFVHLEGRTNVISGRKKKQTFLSSLFVYLH